MLLIMVLLAGPLIVGFGVYEAVHDRRLRREGVRVEGRVVRHRRGTSPRGGGEYFTAVVGFVDPHGRSWECEAKSSGVKGLPVGGPAPVRYVPGAPEGARLDLTGKRLESILGVLAIGTLFTAAGIWMVATGRG